MAAKRRIKRKTMSARTSTTRAVSVRRKRASSGFNPQKAIFGGVVYGAARAKVAQLISPLTSKIPLGSYADEAAMGVISYFVAKGKIKFIPKEVGLAGLMIESAVIGQDVANGTFAGGFGGNGASTKSSKKGVQSY